MTAKDKASILFTLMWGVIDNGMPREEAKRCALIAVSEIINSRPTITDSQVEYKNYWEEVKQEIEKL